MKRVHSESEHQTASVNKKRKLSLTSGFDQAKEKVTQWYKGSLCPIKKGNAWFIRPLMGTSRGV